MLLCIRSGSSQGGHKTVGHFVRVELRGGVTFRDIKLNAGGIESKYTGKGAVDSLAGRFGKIHHVLEH